MSILIQFAEDIKPRGFVNKDWKTLQKELHDLDDYRNRNENQ